MSHFPNELRYSICTISVKIKPKPHTSYRSVSLKQKIQWLSTKQFSKLKTGEMPLQKFSMNACLDGSYAWSTRIFIHIDLGKCVFSWSLIWTVILITFFYWNVIYTYLTKRDCSVDLELQKLPNKTQAIKTNCLGIYA